MWASTEMNRAHWGCVKQGGRDAWESPGGFTRKGGQGPEEKRRQRLATQRHFACTGTELWVSLDPQVCAGRAERRGLTSLGRAVRYGRVLRRDLTGCEQGTNQGSLRVWCGGDVGQGWGHLEGGA